MSAPEYVRLAERASGPVPRAVDPAYVWGDALEELDRVDPQARIINLETSVTTRDEHEPKGINYRMHPANVACLKAAGVDCAVLANNHTLDWGVRGLVDTIEALTAAGIAVAGAGRDLAEAESPAVLELDGGGRILVFACGLPDSGIPAHWGAAAARAGIQLLDDLSDQSADVVGERIRATRRPDDVVIGSVHWGGNWGYDVAPEHRRFARALVDRAGVDLVHGHSSHHPKGIEVYRGRLVLYGCGDFLNDYEGISGYERFRSDLVLMYLPRIDGETGRLLSLEMTPLRVRRFRLQRASEEESEWMGETMARESQRLGTDVSRSGASLVLDW